MHNVLKNAQFLLHYQYAVQYLFPLTAKNSPGFFSPPIDKMIAEWVKSQPCRRLPTEYTEGIGID